MNSNFLRATIALTGVLFAGSGQASHAQAQGTQPPRPPTEITQVRFNSGQSVVPYFEGWIRNGDGTFDMVFGYFNRNWKQDFAIPAGPDNKVEPNGPDGGQPTFFLPRRQRFVYRVRVPADFGKKEVVWTITANGRTEQGFGNLLPEQEITERVVRTNGNFNPGLDDPNKPPSMTISPAQTAAIGVPLKLTATVSDDGLPKPRTAPPSPRPSAAATGQANFGAQVDRSGDSRPRGLRVTWMQYSGPGKIVFDTEGPIFVTDGQATTTARFPVPGSYRLIANANDGAMATRVELAIAVTGK